MGNWLLKILSYFTATSTYKTLRNDAFFLHVKVGIMAYRFKITFHHPSATINKTPCYFSNINRSTQD